MDLYFVRGQFTQPELLKAHQKLDLAVMQAYGYSKDFTEADCVADLMRRYQRLVGSG